MGELMTHESAEYWDKIRHALDKLVEAFVYHPDVTLIDAGYAPAEQGGNGEKVVLRIHVRERWLRARPEERTAFPAQVDGIPVVVMPAGDIRPETRSSTYR
jgi:hypothetical protein